MWFYMHALKHFFIVFFILRITRPWKGFTLAGKLLRINRIFMLISTHESERVLWKMCQLFKRQRMSVSERGEWEEKKTKQQQYRGTHKKRTIFSWHCLFETLLHSQNTLAFSATIVFSPIFFIRVFSFSAAPNFLLNQLEFFMTALVHQ